MDQTADFVAAFRETAAEMRREIRREAIVNVLSPVRRWRRLVAWWTCAAAIEKAYEQGRKHGRDLGWAYARLDRANDPLKTRAEYEALHALEKQIAKERMNG